MRRTDGAPGAARERSWQVRAQMTLWRRSTHVFDVEIQRSYVGYMMAYIANEMLGW